MQAAREAPESSAGVLRAGGEGFPALRSPRGGNVRSRPHHEHEHGMSPQLELPELRGDGAPHPPEGMKHSFREAPGGGLAAAFAAGRLGAAGWLALNALLLAATARLLGRVSEAESDLFYLYYQPFLPVLAMLWLWGVAVRYFERYHVRYDVCFSAEDQRYLLPSASILKICNVLSSLVLGSGVAFLHYCAAGDARAAAFHPPALYLCMLALALFPGDLLFRDTRLFLSSTFWRVVTPIRGVTWADFLLADVLTSLAKALSDTERAVCHMMTGPVMHPEGGASCGDASFIIPLGVALPYVWRLLQCLRVYADTGARPQLLNALKYSTAFPVIALSSVKYHVTQEAWRGTYKPLWLAAALLNSCYSYYWDVERDWEIGFFSQVTPQCSLAPRPVLAPALLYRRAFYLYLMASNAALRLAWTYKLSPHLRRNHLVVFAFVLMEAFRRFQWVFVRIEVELRKLQAAKPELGTLVPATQPGGGGGGSSRSSSSDLTELMPHHGSSGGGAGSHHQRPGAK